MSETDKAYPLIDYDKMRCQLVRNHFMYGNDVFSCIEFLKENPCNSYTELLSLLDNIREEKQWVAVSVMYYSLQEYYLESEISRILIELHCPEKDIFTMIIWETIKDENKLVSMAKLIYPKVSEKFDVSVKTIGERVRDAIAYMYMKNPSKISEICFIYGFADLPRTRAFFQDLVSHVQQIKYEVEIKTFRIRQGVVVMP